MIEMFKSNRRSQLQKHINLNYKLKYLKLENKIEANQATLTVNLK